MAENGNGNIGKNVKVSLEGDAVVIRMDKNLDFGPSKSMKNTIVATTSGNQWLMQGGRR